MSDYDEEAAEAADTTIACLTGGMLDGHIDRLQAAVVGRREALRIQLAVSNRVSLKPGDRVLLSMSMSVQQLRGAKGVVTLLDEKWVSVRLDTPYGSPKRYAVRVPYSGIVRGYG